MNIIKYEELAEALESFVEKCGNPYNAKVTQVITKNTEFPVIRIVEIRNTTNQRANTYIQKVATVGYMVEIYAKNSNKILKSRIARELAQMVDNFMEAQRLIRMEYSSSDNEQNSICRIVLTYMGTLDEYRNKFI